MSTCDDLHPHLDDLLDDQVAEPLRSRLQAHLEACASCRDDLASLRVLHARAGSLPAEVAPSRDLWPEIEARLGGRTSKSSLLALAASVIVALGLAGLVALWTGPAELPTSLATPTVDDSFIRAAELARHEDGTLASRRELESALERRRSELPPELAAAIETNMDILQNAMGEIRCAIEESPQQHGLDHLLANRYQQEVGILRRLERL